MQEKIKSASGNVSQIRNALENTSASVLVATNEETKADGNGVDMNEQSVELARNAFQQQHVYNAISTELSLLRTVAAG